MTNAQINEARRLKNYNESHIKKIIISVCLPDNAYGDYYIHAEEAGGNIFVSKELLEMLKEFLEKKDVNSG